MELTGSLPPWVSAKDVILEMLRRLSVKGGVGRVFEYGGPGIACLNVPQRATITNMGAELGATSSLFPSDEVTRRYMVGQGRDDSWQALSADDDAEYDQVVEIDLSALEPWWPSRTADKVVPVREVAAPAGDPGLHRQLHNSWWRPAGRWPPSSGAAPWPPTSR